jgi:carbamate kinase
MESARDPAVSRACPFDVLGAMTQGMIGYWLLQALQNALPDRQVTCLVSRILVSRDDPAFGNPSKFVGPVYDEDQARALAASPALGHSARRCPWRRVVPSPEPVGLLDLPVIRTLVDGGG